MTGGGEQTRQITSPVIRGWDDLAEGTKAVIKFRYNADDMVDFARLSGDHNPLHTDAAFARSKSMDGPVVYGALLLAQLSRLIGMDLPGRDGMWVSVAIDFASPLFVGEDAVLEAEVVHRSDSTRCIEMKVRFSGPNGLIAKGTVQALLR